MGIAAAALTTALLPAPALAASATEPVAANPVLAERCDLDLAVTLDLSNSVTEPQLAQVRTELADLAAALHGYPVRLAVQTFASRAPATDRPTEAPLRLTSLVDDAGVATVDEHVAQIARPATRDGGTNWDRALAAAADSGERYDAVLVVTDGNPTQYGAPPLGPGNSTDTATIDAAVRSANLLKATGTRVIAVGVQDNLAGAALAEFRENVSQISGPGEGQDYHLSGFAKLRETLVGIVDSRCGAITLDKTGALAPGARGITGDTVDYSFVVTNTGTVALRDIELVDPKPGLSPLSFGPWPGPERVLEPGQSVTASAVYTLDDDDIARGVVDNLATVTGTTPAGGTVSDDDPATVPLPELAAGIRLEKTGSLEGDTIVYSFVITNVGEAALSGVTLSDRLPGLSDIVFGPWPATAGHLAPGESVTATASYATTEADRDAGRVTNTATTGGTPPRGDEVTDTDEHVVPLPPRPGTVVPPPARTPEAEPPATPVEPAPDAGGSLARTGLAGDGITALAIGGALAVLIGAGTLAASRRRSRT